MAEMGPDGLVVETDAMLVSNRAKIIAFAAERRLPTLYGNLDYIPDGGLMAYFTSIFDTWRRLATYVDRVLKGAKPADLRGGLDRSRLRNICRPQYFPPECPSCQFSLKSGRNLSENRSATS